MIDATPALQAAIPTITVDAAESRSALPGPDILATLAAQGNLGAAVVVGLGSNGGISCAHRRRGPPGCGRTTGGDGHQPLPVLQLDTAWQHDHPLDVRPGPRVLRRGLGRTRAGTSRMVRSRRRPHVEQRRGGRGLCRTRARATVSRTKGARSAGDPRVTTSTVRSMPETFDFVVVGGGRRARSSPLGSRRIRACRVALVEAGGPPPPQEVMPVACPALQLNPETDWMYTADAGGCGLGLARRPDDGAPRQDARRVVRHQLHGVRPRPSRRLRLLGRRWRDRVELRRGLALLQEERGPGRRAATSSSTPTRTTPKAPSAYRCGHRCSRGAQEFVDAAVAAGIPAATTTAAIAAAPTASCRCLQTTHARRQAVEHVSRVPRGRRRAAPEPRGDLPRAGDAGDPRGDAGQLRRPGVEYRTADGETVVARADKEVVLSAGAVGSPQILLLSGIGPKRELEAVGVPCQLDAPDVGKHLKDHLQVGLVFPAPGVGVSMTEVGVVDGSRRAAGARRAVAGRPRRRCGPARGAPGAQGRGRAAA